MTGSGSHGPKDVVAVATAAVRRDFSQNRRRKDYKQAFFEGAKSAFSEEELNAVRRSLGASAPSKKPMGLNDFGAVLRRPILLRPYVYSVEASFYVGRRGGWAAIYTVYVSEHGPEVVGEEVLRRY